MAGALDGKVALVTGAGKNIGRAIALHLARDGATVVVNGRSDRAALDAVVAEIAAMGGRARAHLADVSDEAAVARMTDAVAAELGGIDIAINSTGWGLLKPFLDTTHDDIVAITALQFIGPIHFYQAMVRKMARSRGGRGGSISDKAMRPRPAAAHTF